MGGAEKLNNKIASHKDATGGANMAKKKATKKAAKKATKKKASKKKH